MILFLVSKKNTSLRKSFAFALIISEPNGLKLKKSILPYHGFSTIKETISAGQTRVINIGAFC